MLERIAEKPRSVTLSLDCCAGPVAALHMVSLDMVPCFNVAVIGVLPVLWLSSREKIAPGRRFSAVPVHVDLARHTHAASRYLTGDA